MIWVFILKIFWVCIGLYDLYISVLGVDCCNRYLIFVKKCKIFLKFCVIFCLIWGLRYEKKNFIWEMYLDFQFNLVTGWIKELCRIFRRCTKHAITLQDSQWNICSIQLHGLVSSSCFIFIRCEVWSIRPML